MAKILRGKYLEEAVNDIAYSVRTLRKSNRMTQQALAGITGISRTHLSRIESGAHIPTLTSLIKICEALNARVSVSFNLKDINTKNKVNDGTAERELFSK